jgi:hypothetical protein
MTSIEGTMTGQKAPTLPWRFTLASSKLRFQNGAAPNEENNCALSIMVLTQSCL